MSRRIITIKDKIEAEYSDGPGLPDPESLTLWSERERDQNGDLR